MDSFEDMVKEIGNLVNDLFEESSIILGITIAAPDGRNLYSRFREDYKMSLSQNEIAAASTSLLFLAENMIGKLLNQDLQYALLRGENVLFLSMCTRNIAGAVILDRKLIELTGIAEYKEKIRNLFLKISAIVETAPGLGEDLFIKIKRTIPNALAIAIINNQGLPIKVQSTMEEPKLSAFIYALYQLGNLILKGKSEYTLVGGTYGSIIVLQVDDERILGVAVPESDDTKIGKYIAKLEEIVRNPP